MKTRLVLLTAVAVLWLCSISSAGLMVYADADGFSDGEDISNAFNGMTLSSAGQESGLDGKVYVKTDSHASTGTMTFGNNRADPTLWRMESNVGIIPDATYLLAVFFDMPARYVAIDMIGEIAGSGIMSGAGKIGQ